MNEHENIRSKANPCQFHEQNSSVKPKFKLNIKNTSEKLNQEVVQSWYSTLILILEVKIKVFEEERSVNQLYLR